MWHFSEIIERHVQSVFIQKKLTPPDIPEEYVKNFPYMFSHIYEMYSKAKSDSRYCCTLKDCSLGGVFPVAALLSKKVPGIMVLNSDVTPVSR